jgi:uncharacterized membrane protein
VLPGKAVEIYTHPVGLLAFVATFCIVAGVWHSHNRLFADFFIPNRLSIFLNFVLLGFTLLLVYMLQVYTHFQPASSFATIVGYIVCFCVVYGLLGVLYAIGLRERWTELDAETRRRGMLAMGRSLAIAIGLLAGCSIAYALGKPLTTGFFAMIPLFLFARIFVARRFPAPSR